MARLGVNIDHVATLRQARGGHEPNPITAAVLADLGGADGIVVHLREDRRHIQEHDLKLLRETAPNTLNLEMAAEESVAKIALQIRPDKITLVPERRQELTTEGGLAVTKQPDRINAIIQIFHDAQIPVCVFIDPDPHQIQAAKEIGADAIELHTGRYANSRQPREMKKELDALSEGTNLAHTLGVEVNAGHGLTYHNVQPLILIRQIVEFNIGHSIISRAVLIGLERAVREMKILVSSSLSPTSL